MQISSKSVLVSSLKLTTKNAWARYVRRRWRENTLKASMSEWGLTEGEARGLLYAQASQSTIDKILDHPNGGFALGLEILAVKCGTTLEAYVEQQGAQAEHERNRWEARQREIERMEAALRRRVAEPRRLGGRDD